MNRQRLLYSIGVMIMLATCIYLGYEANRIYHLANAGAALSLSATKFERSISGGKEILILGDSLAYGVGASDREKSFAGRISEEYRDATIVNKSQIGETVTSLRNTIENKIDKRYEKIYIVVGGNDIMRMHIDIYNSANSLGYIINKASHSSEKVVLVTTGNFSNVSLSPWILSGVFNMRANIVRNAALKLEDTFSNFDYIDFYKVPIGKVEYKKLEAQDGYHLNDSGIERLVSTVLEAS